MLEVLEPDAWALHHASHVTLKPCPFCGNRSVLPLSYVNRNAMGGKTVYRVIVVCNGRHGRPCETTVGHNAATLEEARQGALARWEQRA